MRIKVTEIEASAEELRQSNSLADSFSRMLRNAFTSTDTLNREAVRDLFFGEEEDDEEEDDE